MSEHQLVLNGKTISFRWGQTILEVARENGVQIPTLCYLKDASPTGACRICLVEVEGARNLNSPRWVQCRRTRFGVSVQRRRFDWRFLRVTVFRENSRPKSPGLRP